MSEPIRILEVVAKMNLAGTETMLMNLYRNIDRSKIQFDFAVCTENHCDYEDEILSMGGCIIRYPRYTGKNHFSYTKWWHDFFKNNPQYRIVHGHIGSTAAIYLNIANKYGCYTIAHSHGILEPLSLRSLIWRIYSYPTRYVANYFFGCSMKALENRYGKKIAHNKEKAKVLNNAIETSKYQYNSIVREEVRKELEIAPNEWILGTVGRLSKPKNPFMILDILQELNIRGEKFRFVWVGEGELRQEIEKEIVKRNLKEKIIMLGLRKDVYRIMQALDIFIFPSVCEGLGIVSVEAQTAGLLTLCSDRVPKEAKVTNLCHFISINDVSKWVNIIINNKNYKRMDMVESVIKNGFDIHDTAKMLQKFYLNNCSETIYV